MFYWSSEQNLILQFWSEYSIKWPPLAIPNESEASRLERCILHYRAIYILNNDFNLVFGKLILPFLKFALIITFSLSFFAVARLFNDLGSFSLFFLGMYALCGAALLAPLAIVTSSMFDLSSQFHRNVSSNIGLSTGIQIKRRLQQQLISCPIIRCQIGNLYYMEGKAKLTMVHNILNLLACLLIESGWSCCKIRCVNKYTYILKLDWFIDLALYS